MRPLHLLLVIAAADGATADVKRQLRRHLFAEYEPADEPTWEIPTLQNRGVVVSLGLQLGQIESIDLLHGVITLPAKVDMTWRDIRLRWDNLAEFRGVTSLSVHATRVMPGSTPPSAIWVPDIELMNGASSIDETAYKDALVYSDGTVRWSRLARLRAQCAFRGIELFPNDWLSCGLKFGPWMLDDRFEDLTFESRDARADLLLEVSEAPSLEYNLSAVSVARNVETRDCCGSRRFPYVQYELTIRRFDAYYNFRITSVTAMITYLSFGVFFAHPQAINRQHFSSTMLLTVITYDIFASGGLPRAPILWLDFFMYISWLFVFLVSVENFVVLYIFWKADATILAAEASGVSRVIGRLFRAIASARASAAERLETLVDSADARLSERGISTLRRARTPATPLPLATGDAPSKKRRSSVQMQSRAYVHGAGESPPAMGTPKSICRARQRTKPTACDSPANAMATDDLDSFSFGSTEKSFARASGAGAADGDGDSQSTQTKEDRDLEAGLVGSSQHGDEASPGKPRRKRSIIAQTLSSHVAPSRFASAPFHLYVHVGEKSDSMATSLDRIRLARSLEHSLLSRGLDYFYKKHHEELAREIKDFEVTINEVPVNPAERCDRFVVQDAQDAPEDAPDEKQPWSLWRMASKGSGSSEGSRCAGRDKKPVAEAVTTPTVVTMTLRPDVESSGDTVIEKAVCHVYIAGGKQLAVQTVLAKKSLERPLKDSLVLPALQHYFKVHPRERTVDVEHVHVTIDGEAAILDLPLYGFVKPNGQAVELVLTLPLVSADASAALEAAAVASAQISDHSAASASMLTAGPRGSKLSRESDDFSESGSESGSTSFTGSASRKVRRGSQSRADFAPPKARSRKSSFVDSWTPTLFAEIASATKGQGLLQVKNASKVLSRAVTATKIDPSEAALVRKVFRVLDEGKKGKLDAKDIESWVHHFGAVPGAVLHECGVLGRSEWTVDEFKAICLHAVQHFGGDKFNLMVRGVEETKAESMATRVLYWHTLAIRIDRWCIVAFTSLYTLALVVLHLYRDWGRAFVDDAEG